MTAMLDLPVGQSRLESRWCDLIRMAPERKETSGREVVGSRRNLIQVKAMDATGSRLLKRSRIQHAWSRVTIMPKGTLWPLVMILIAGSPRPGWAEDEDIGQANFRMSCASCHGTDGKGSGPVSGQLKVPPPDLTVLARKNDGVFPISRVYEIIDGRQQVIAHGPRDMPIWGFQYSLEQRLRGYPASAVDPDAIVRMRILSIIDYLSRIQQK